MIPTIAPTIKQHKAWGILLDKITTEFVFGGGAGGGKSWLGCEWLTVQCLTYPDTKWFIARKTLKNLKKTTLRTFFKVAKYHGLKKDEHFIYNEQSATILFPQTGSIIDLLEVKYNPSDPDYEDLGSSEYTGGWLEEAGEIDFRAYDTLKSRIGRQNNDKYGILGKLLITCNPKKNWLYRLFFKPWKIGLLDSTKQFLQSLVDDNPKNESGYRSQLLSIIDNIKRQRLLYGNWEYDDEPNAMIKYDSIMDMFTNTVNTDGKYMSVDVARLGRDTTTIKLWRGLESYRTYIYNKQDTEVTKQKVREIAADEQIPFSQIVVDEDGVGGGVVDGLGGVKGFVNNSRPLARRDKPTEVPNYRNLKTQCYYILAEMINAHKIAVKTEVVSTIPGMSSEKFKESLIEELEQVIAKDPDADDKRLQIIPKDEVKENIGRSPDFSDALMMRMYFELEPDPASTPEELISEARERMRAQRAVGINKAR